MLSGDGEDPQGRLAKAFGGENTEIAMAGVAQH